MIISMKNKIKRVFDFFLAFLACSIFAVPIVLLIILSSVTTKEFGLFRQLRVGRKGKLFYIYKIKTMVSQRSMVFSDITVAGDRRITFLGKFLRKYKLDELPQFFNVLIGDMSFVGPRPDVPGYADCLPRSQQSFLDLRPGITCPASLIFRDEEYVLSICNSPEEFNDHMIWPFKVKCALEYHKSLSIWYDIKVIFLTALIAIFPVIFTPRRCLLFLSLPDHLVNDLQSLSVCDPEILS